MFAIATPDLKKITVMGVIKEKILPKSSIYTDDFSIYDDLGRHRNEYVHRRINHSAKVYVMGTFIHTNTIEGFWSLVKRGTAGVYHSVSQKYLQTCLNEYSFRYNRRNQGNLIFTSILERAVERAS